MTDPIDPAGTRSTHLPSAGFSDLKLSPVLVRGRSWYRIFDRGKDPIYFNKRKGNRFTPLDGRHDVLYVADEIRTCFLETFGDDLYAGKSRIARNRWLTKAIARLEMPNLRMCDLTDASVLRRIGLDKGSLYATSLSVPQAWAKAIMDHPADFDGILYSSRFGDGRCIAVFETARVATHVRELERVDLHGSEDGDDLVTEFNIVLV